MPESLPPNQQLELALYRIRELRDSKRSNRESLVEAEKVLTDPRELAEFKEEVMAWLKSESLKKAGESRYQAQFQVDLLKKQLGGGELSLDQAQLSPLKVLGITQELTTEIKIEFFRLRFLFDFNPAHYMRKRNYQSKRAFLQNISKS